MPVISIAGGSSRVRLAYPHPIGPIYVVRDSRRGRERRHPVEDVPAACRGTLGDPVPKNIVRNRDSSKARGSVKIIGHCIVPVPSRIVAPGWACVREAVSVAGGGQVVELGIVAVGICLRAAPG